MQFVYVGGDIVLKGLKQSKLLEESSNLKLSELEKKGVVLQIMEGQDRKGRAFLSYLGTSIWLWRCFCIT